MFKTITLIRSLVVVVLAVVCCSGKATEAQCGLFNPPTTGGDSTNYAS